LLDNKLNFIESIYVTAQLSLYDW